jgi:hypothetical protein
MKLPLRIEYNRLYPGECSIVDADGLRLFRNDDPVSYGFDKDDAEFIVAACNAYKSVSLEGVTVKAGWPDEPASVNVEVDPELYKLLARRGSLTMALSTLIPHTLKALLQSEMTETRAREILFKSSWLTERADGGLSWNHGAVVYTPTSRASEGKEYCSATLDGEFTADELEAIAWWMRNKAAPT